MNLADLHPIDLNDLPEKLIQAVLRRGAEWGGAAMMNEAENIAFMRDPVHASVGERELWESTDGWIHPEIFSLNQWKTVYVINDGPAHWQAPEVLQWYQDMVVQARAYPQDRSRKLCDIVNTFQDHFVLQLSVRNYREYSRDKAMERRGRIQRAKFVLGKVWR